MNITITTPSPACNCEAGLLSKPNPYCPCPAGLRARASDTRIMMLELVQLFSKVVVVVCILTMLPLAGLSLGYSVQMFCYMLWGYVPDMFGATAPSPTACPPCPLVSSMVGNGMAYFDPDSQYKAPPL